MPDPLRLDHWVKRLLFRDNRYGRRPSFPLRIASKVMDHADQLIGGLLCHVRVHGGYRVDEPPFVAAETGKGAFMPDLAIALELPLDADIGMKPSAKLHPAIIGKRKRVRDQARQPGGQPGRQIVRVAIEFEVLDLDGGFDRLGILGAAAGCAQVSSGSFGYACLRNACTSG